MKANPKLWSVADVKKFLLHAYQHCMWGSESDNTIRDAEPSDIEAAVTLLAIREKVN